MAVFLQDRARKIASPNDQDFLVVLFKLFDQRDEVAIATNDYESVDVISRERHFQRVQSQIDVRTILVATRREIALNHLNRVLRHASAVLAGALPVAVRDFRDNFPSFLYRLQNRANIEMTVKGALNSYFNVVKVYEYGDF